MIFYVATERFASTMRHFMRSARGELRVMKLLTYEELLFERAGPIGHYIFTDLDRLSRYELECVASFARALREAVPEARILNHPLKVLERYPLLLTLHRAGINDFTATRIESGEPPPRYPVFIRPEDGHGGPDTDLLHDHREFAAALDDLVRRGLPRRGRLAIGFANERDLDGYFHKYAAFSIDGRIIPYHRISNSNWVVKFRAEGSRRSIGRDEAYGNSAAAVAAELRYVTENPHRDVLARAFSLSGIDYGRADYGIIGGRVQIYEINTNPHLPLRRRHTRAERREIVRGQILEAFAALDAPLAVRGRVRFRVSRPGAHNLHWPRRRLPFSLVRGLVGLFGGRSPP